MLDRTPCVLVPELHLPSVRVGAYLVAPRYFPGVSLQDAHDLAAAHGCELPTKDLVDEIYRAADCKLNGYDFAEATDGTARTMAAPALILRNAAKVYRAISKWEEKHGTAAVLVAGTNKDVIRLAVGYTSKYGKAVPAGALGIYGWHDNHGVPIQGANYVGAGPRSHAPTWCDYSQGARLVRLA